MIDPVGMKTMKQTLSSVLSKALVWVFAILAVFLVAVVDPIAGVLFGALTVAIGAIL